MYTFKEQERRICLAAQPENSDAKSSRETSEAAFRNPGSGDEDHIGVRKRSGLTGCEM